MSRYQGFETTGAPLGRGRLTRPLRPPTSSVSTSQSEEPLGAAKTRVVELIAKDILTEIKQQLEVQDVVSSFEGVDNLPWGTAKKLSHLRALERYLMAQLAAVRRQLQENEKASVEEAQNEEIVNESENPGESV